jgi:hypothetical protein
MWKTKHMFHLLWFLLVWCTPMDLSIIQSKKNEIFSSYLYNNTIVIFKNKINIITSTSSFNHFNQKHIQTFGINN